MQQPGRTTNGGNYRFGFNGKENDNEVKGNGNSVNFGSRIYDSRLGRWLSCDPKANKYPSYSPYHSFYCNPINVVDADGEENLIVVGAESIDKPGTYPDNKRNFLEAGLNQAIQNKTNKTENNEQTTMLVYRGDYAQKELDHYEKEASKNGITFKVVDKAADVKDYINKKSKDASGNERDGDKITDFSFFGHGTPGLFLLRANSGVNLGISDIDPVAFSQDNCDVLLAGCQEGEYTPKFARTRGQLTLFDFFKEKVISKGKIIGARGNVNWGKDDKGKFGVGKYVLNQRREENGSAEKKQPKTESTDNDKVE